MAAQGYSRKRPAPGSSPTEFSHQRLQYADSYGDRMTPGLSDEQFLQWGQIAQPLNSFTDGTTYNENIPVLNGQAAQPSNQLARRPLSQLASRSRPDDESGVLQWMEPTSGGAQHIDGASEDDIEELERKAQFAKKEALAKRKQIPPFVQKLSSFLDNNQIHDLIQWADGGKSFVVLDEDEFARQLIPNLFKHNNYASFVRQLNMYGFHKKVGLSDNSMRASEKKSKSPSEYSNPYFRQGHPDLLWLIQKPKNVGGQGPKGRNKNKGDADQNDDDLEEYVEEVATSHEGFPRHRGQLAIGQGDNTLNQEQMATIQRELASIRQHQVQITRMMASLNRDHEQLYDQAATFQEQHSRHENSINAILTFLATMYNRNLQGHDGAQGIPNLFAGSIPPNSNQTNVVDVGNYSFDSLNGSDPTAKAFKRQPLLIKAAPMTDQSGGRASTVSSPSSKSALPDRQTRRMAPTGRTGIPTQTGTLEELFGNNQPTPTSLNPDNPTAETQRDIMSVIQNTNALHSQPNTPAADFTNVLISLENSGGHTPLTNSQRADMLRLINNSAKQISDNALISPNPPSLPADYDRKLASTKADLDHLARLQAQQNRSVENLTSLLQPLSPTGSIPGLDDGTNVPPPLVDFDDMLNQNGYFPDYSDGNGMSFDESGNPTDVSLNFTGLGDGDEELFPNLSIDSDNQQGAQGFGLFKNDQSDLEGGGRVESVPSSEGATPATSTGGFDIENNGGMKNGMSLGKTYVDGGNGGKSPAKRRRRKE